MVKRAESADEAWNILHKHCWLVGNELAVTLDSEYRVDIKGDLTFKRKQQKEFPLWFGKVTGKFQADGLALGKLEGAPYWVGKDFSIKQNRLISTIGGPQHVGASYYATGNPLENLDGLATHIGDAISFDYNENLPLLRTLVAKRIWPSPDQVELERILRKYSGQGRRAAHLCAKELIAAGFEGNARW